jgi:hypothetical protein
LFVFFLVSIIRLTQIEIYASTKRTTPFFRVRLISVISFAPTALDRSVFSRLDHTLSVAHVVSVIFFGSKLTNLLGVTTTASPGVYFSLL